MVPKRTTCVSYSLLSVAWLKVTEGDRGHTSYPIADTSDSGGASTKLGDGIDRSSIMMRHQEYSASEWKSLKEEISVLRAENMELKKANAQLFADNQNLRGSKVE